MRIKTTFSMLLLSAACVTPALANYFHNQRLNLYLNVGSAPSPTPRDVRENRLPRLVQAVRPPANAARKTDQAAGDEQASVQVEGKSLSTAQALR